jgi:hypothetical protein
MEEAQPKSILPSAGVYTVTVAGNKNNPYDALTRISKNGSFELDLDEDAVKEAEPEVNFSYVAYHLGSRRVFVLPASDLTREAIHTPPYMATIKINGRVFQVLVDIAEFTSENKRIMSGDDLMLFATEIAQDPSSSYTKPVELVKALENGRFQAWSAPLMSKVADAEIELEKEALRNNWDKRAGADRKNQFIANELDEIHGILGKELFNEIVLAPEAK